MDREKKKNKNTIQNKNTAAGVKLWWGDGEREKYDFKMVKTGCSNFKSFDG